MKIPKLIINDMLNILFINDNKDISDDSSRKALEFAKIQEKKYRKTLYYGLLHEIRAYKKRVKLENKRKALLGE